MNQPTTYATIFQAFDVASAFGVETFPQYIRSFLRHLHQLVTLKINIHRNQNKLVPSPQNEQLNFVFFRNPDQLDHLIHP